MDEQPRLLDEEPPEGCATMKDEAKLKALLEVLDWAITEIQRS